jgi:hypothetical protein
VYIQIGNTKLQAYSPTLLLQRKQKAAARQNEKKLFPFGV